MHSQTSTMETSRRKRESSEGKTKCVMKEEKRRRGRSRIRGKGRRSSRRSP